jgi:hypothetical protein
MSENKNAFEQLRDEHEEKFGEHSNKIKKNIESQKDIWSFLGELIELYIPKILSVLLGGANTDSIANKKSDDN